MAEHGVEGYRSMKLAIAAAAAAKNATLTRDGFTPNQRVFGSECRWPSLNDEDCAPSFAEAVGHGVRSGKVPSDENHCPNCPFEARCEGENAEGYPEEARNLTRAIFSRRPGVLLDTRSEEQVLQDPWKRLERPRNRVGSGEEQAILRELAR